MKQMKIIDRVLFLIISLAMLSWILGSTSFWLYMAINIGLVALRFGIRNSLRRKGWAIE